MLRTVQHTDIDGVPVYWVDGPPPLTAALMFRVGIRDEPFPQRGITHLVEHLAMSRLGRRPHDHNASVDVAMTTFEAAGSAEAVTTFLRDICVAVHDLPSDRLDTERKVIAVEVGEGPGILDHHLLLRYGLRGPGLAGAVPPAPQMLDLGAARGWARRHFVRPNAVLALTGPPPPRLALPLPDGLAGKSAQFAPLAFGGPVWAEHAGDRGVALSMHLPAGEAAVVGGRIARQRLMGELRHQRGLIYDVDLVIGASASDSSGSLSIVVDPPAHTAALGASVIDATFMNLQNRGPTDEELEYDLAEAWEVRNDPRSALGQAAYAAMEHLHRGRNWDPDYAWAERQKIRAADVHAAFAAYPTTALLTVPHGVTPELEGFSRYPEHFGSPISGQEFKRHVFGPVPRGGRLIVGMDGVSLVLKDGTATVRWSEVAGYGEGPEDLRTLYGQDGCTIDLHPHFFKSGDMAMEIIESHILSEARFPQLIQN